MILLQSKEWPKSGTFLIIIWQLENLRCCIILHSERSFINDFWEDYEILKVNFSRYTGIFVLFE
ncbi:unnamed protein product [Moneuplotes crassus]|uniref:Uncharacterized protein n=1 Tax=Euplotes crassus TaxID=5936 RepID=A0AAD1X9P4_EUPCR|nr:unnamed protein product [Moneuplotes crassus]